MNGGVVNLVTMVRKLFHEYYGEIYYIAIIGHNLLYTNKEIDQVINSSYEELAYENGAFIDKHDGLREIFFRDKRSAYIVRNMINERLGG